MDCCMIYVNVSTAVSLIVKKEKNWHQFAVLLSSFALIITQPLLKKHRGPKNKVKTESLNIKQSKTYK